MSTPHEPHEHLLIHAEAPYLRHLHTGGDGHPYSKHSLRAYTRVIRSFLSFAQENELHRPDDVNAAWIRAYLRHIASLGLSTSSMEVYLAALDGFFGWMEDEGMIDINPIEEYKRESKRKKRGGRAPKRIPPVLYPHEQDALMDVIFSRSHVNRQRDLALIGLMLDSGLRTQEVCDLALDHGRVLLETGQMRVIGKGNKERVIYPLDRHRAHLKAYMEAQGPQDGTRPLFISRSGRPLSQPLLYKTINHYLTQAGIQKPQMGGHLLRHTAASLMLAQGLTIRQVQEYLGHASMLTTEKYVHLL